ncbi:MAG TPA: tRNA 4-thiouridine(8) synthase ThiI [Spirochaetota bacterium]|jgi:tRNA U34 2-thiouridine synthase MnmA/TrmU|nr:MAG: hypothetical protein BWX91_00192 [Spirochaetes bacterium ADurb.Bin133]HNZ25802.1 tRNA 4-thiouridine(8) synthase ThiI [Spirochaetota bacterium]HPY88398.1 tRNA 4-thiouridine(8) synthase ThiI [Spirochaetota bacterium]HQB62411.1 tRNA 4-thiouridine(8) synthase ThiI [Spirochaetota bacterium]
MDNFDKQEVKDSANKIKAIALFSGGLDSILAIKLVESQGIECVAVNFSTPFYKLKNLEKIKSKHGIDVLDVDVTKDFIDVLQNPKYGYGSAINPCIDCKILMMKKAKEMMIEFGAAFIVTGEVEGQRPMSQQKRAMDIIEREAEVKGILLRPLSALIFPETEIERKKIIDRSLLLNISGRSRKIQTELARKFDITNYEQPSGGCILTEKSFKYKLIDYFKRAKNIDYNELKLLKYGRHFRIGENKFIVGRNKIENDTLLSLKNASDIEFSVKNFMGPVTILQGKPDEQSIKTAASLTLSYSDCNTRSAVVVYDNDKEILTEYVDKSAFNDFNITK